MGFWGFRLGALVVASCFRRTSTFRGKGALFVLHLFDSPGQPIVFVTHSNLTAEGSTVLTNAQTYSLGVALKEIHRFFQPLYGSDPSKWYAMDTEFKVTADGVLEIKQARPYPGWNRAE